MKVRRIVAIAIALVALSLVMTGVAARYPVARIGSLVAFNSGFSSPSMRMKSKADLGSYSYFSKVGGIAFDKQALPEEGLAVKSISVRYDPSRPDGGRLLVTLNGKELVAPIYDWKLKPIVDYVASPWYACFSLFGDYEGDPGKAAAVREKFGLEQLPSYHPAFADNLMGLRLLQMDSMYHRGVYGVASTDAYTGEVLKGPGESGLVDPSGFSVYYEIAGRYEGRYKAYVINDRDVDIRFGADPDSGQFRISGELWAYYWNLKSQEAIGAIEAEARAMQSSAQGRIARECGVTVLGNRVSGTRPKIDLFQKRMAEEVKRIEDYVDHAVIEPVPALTAEMAANMGAMRGINPDAYDAIRELMRYAAFFEYLKVLERSTGGGSWKSLAKTMAESDLAHKVITPNAFYKTATSGE